MTSRWRSHLRACPGAYGCEEKLILSGHGTTKIKLSSSLFSFVKNTGPRMSIQTDQVRPNEVYKGADNKFLMDTLISAQFICNFDSVKTYPYGDQICSFSFFLTGSGKLTPGYVSYQGTSEVGQYQISPTAWSIECNQLRNQNNCRNCETVKLCTVSVFLNRNIWR